MKCGSWDKFDKSKQFLNTHKSKIHSKPNAQPCGSLASSVLPVVYFMFIHCSTQVYSEHTSVYSLALCNTRKYYLKIPRPDPGLLCVRNSAFNCPIHTSLHLEKHHGLIMKSKDFIVAYFVPKFCQISTLLCCIWMLDYKSAVCVVDCISQKSN